MFRTLIVLTCDGCNLHMVQGVGPALHVEDDTMMENLAYQQGWKLGEKHYCPLCVKSGRVK